jgi:hypothetical protein
MSRAAEAQFGQGSWVVTAEPRRQAMANGEFLNPRPYVTVTSDGVSARGRSRCATTAWISTIAPARRAY